MASSGTKQPSPESLLVRLPKIETEYGIPYRSTLELLKRRELTKIKIGRAVYVQRREIAELIEKGSKSRKPAAA